MNTEILEIYRKAGRIASDARNWAAENIKPGMRQRDLQEGIEERIRAAGASAPRTRPPATH